MDYNKKLIELLKEAKSFVQYKRLPFILRIFWILTMCPLMVYTAFLIAAYFIYSFIYKGLCAPLDSLCSFMTKQREGAKDMTDAAICLGSTPIIALYKLGISVYAIGFHLLWFPIMLLTYISTLGGVKWQPYVNDATFNNNLASLTPAPSKKTAVIYSLLAFFSPAMSLVGSTIFLILGAVTAIIPVIIGFFPIAFCLVGISIGAGFLAIPLLIIVLSVLSIFLLPTGICIILYYLTSFASPILCYILPPFIFKLKPKANKKIDAVEEI